MSLLWLGAKEIEAAAKPLPTFHENLLNARLNQASAVHSGFSDKMLHEMTPEEFGAHRGTYWHGSPAGEDGLNHGSHSGIHVGSRQAATEALEARIGRPAEGSWDGTREYGKTLLTNHGFGYGSGPGVTRGETRYPDGKASYSSGHPVPLDSHPSVFPVRIVGEMTNTPHSPHEDFKANGLMAGQIRRGTARRGYFYKNVAEDSGSISAVVPNRAHLATHRDVVHHALTYGHLGRPVPQHNLERYGFQ